MGLWASSGRKTATLAFCFLQDAQCMQSDAAKQSIAPPGGAGAPLLLDQAPTFWSNAKRHRKHGSSTCWNASTKSTVSPPLPTRLRALAKNCLFWVRILCSFALACARWPNDRASGPGATRARGQATADPVAQLRLLAPQCRHRRLRVRHGAHVVSVTVKISLCYEMKTALLELAFSQMKTPAGY